MSDALRDAAQATADWLSVLQATYHGTAQRFPNETRDTCDAGLCGDYRHHRDALYAALAAEPDEPTEPPRPPWGWRSEPMRAARSREEPGLDVERLAKALQVGVGPKRIEDYNPDDFYRDYATAVIAEYDRLASRG